MGNNKVKSKGQLQGKKATGKKDLHPDSRKIKQITRVELRTKRVEENKKERNTAEQDKIRRLFFFIEAMDTSKERLDVEGLHQLAEQFCQRLNGEIASEQKQRRPGRPMSKRQEELEAAKRKDEQEYTKEGLLMPDLTNEDCVVSMKYWRDTLKGKSGYLTRLRLVRVFKGSDSLVVAQEGMKLTTKAFEAELPREDGDNDSEDEMETEEVDA